MTVEGAQTQEIAGQSCMCTSTLLYSRHPRSSVALISRVYIVCRPVALAHHCELLRPTSEVVGTTLVVSVTHPGRLLMLTDSVDLPLSPTLLKNSYGQEIPHLLCSGNSSLPRIILPHVT